MFRLAESTVHCSLSDEAEIVRTHRWSSGWGVVISIPLDLMGPIRNPVPHTPLILHGDISYHEIVWTGVKEQQSNQVPGPPHHIT